MEWLETNGTGAFAMGTLAGLNTRRYHALLVASLKPPTDRYVLLSRFEEEAVVDGRAYALFCCQYPGKLVQQGRELLEGFHDQPCATWNYDLQGVKLERQVYLVPGRQAVVVRYRSDKILTLQIRPFLAYRDYHSLSRARPDLYAGLPPIAFHSAAELTPDPKWYYNIEYLAELERGLDFREDQFTPGILSLQLRPNEWTPVCASIDGTQFAAPPSGNRDPLDRFLVRRFDGKPTIIAGYPWFTDWGRDTMISLPGFFTKREYLDTAREIIEGFLQFRNQGIIPNRFPDTGGTPEYNTADATLWMFQSLHAWLRAGGDKAFLTDVFYPAAKEIIEWHRRGTHYGIGVDPVDSLLRAGPQTTWMDTRFTPRNGKPVEINALWHAALALMAKWGRALADPAAEDYRTEETRVRASFRAGFWNAERGCLFDVLRPDRPDAKLRPNQIFAASLPFGLLNGSQQQSVVRVVERDLLTPVGLRTLARDDPDYKPHYHGSPMERDAAYHHGTVWPWLMGPFIDAYLNAFGKTTVNLDYCRGLIVKLEAEVARAGCVGSISELYDADIFNDEEHRRPRGCPAQAWSVAEVARVKSAYGWDS